MACPTCSHTMYGLGTGHDIWNCPRCGTMRHGDTIIVPALVERVRKLKETMKEEVGFSAYDVNLWCKLGITDSVWLPGERWGT